MAFPLLLIITGPPGAGKTTIGRRLAVDLRLPFMNKDDIKETLFDTLGWGTAEQSSRLGPPSFALLACFARAVLTTGRSVALEANFSPLASTETFLTLHEGLKYETIQVVCSAPPDVLLQRFNDREAAGERHPGHHGYTSREAFYAHLRERTYGSLPIGGEVIEVDTTTFGEVDYAQLLRTIGAFGPQT